MTPQKLWIAFSALYRKEVQRFLRIYMQTIFPYIVNQSLYFMIFGVFIGSRVGTIEGVSYIAFIIPGIILMAVINASYDNVVSSFFGSKFQRNIEEILVSPMPYSIVILGYTLAGATRGILLGAILMLVSYFFYPFTVAHPWILMFALFATAYTWSLAGLINGIFAEKFDDTVIFRSFILTPLTYLGGVFYPISALSDTFQTISHFNPIVYFTEIMRYSFTNTSSIPLGYSLSVVGSILITLLLLAFFLFHRGKGIRN